MKDLPLAYYFQTLLGGHIHLRTNSCTLTFKSKKSVLTVIHLINGYMRTPKIEALHRLINWFNLKHCTQIIPLGLDETPLQSNSWLSGFLDADGGFFFNWKLSKITGLPIRLAYNMRISQRQQYNRTSFVGKSYYPIMSKISNFISVPIGFIDREHKNGVQELGYVVISLRRQKLFVKLHYS